MAKRSAMRSSKTGALENRLLAISKRSKLLKGRTHFGGGHCKFDLRAGRWLSIQAGADPGLRFRCRSQAKAGSAAAISKRYNLDGTRSCTLQVVRL